MAAVALSYGVDTITAITTARQRYTLPTIGAHHDVRIYSASDVYLELLDVSDGSARGATYQTLVGGQQHTRRISRREFAISGAGSQSVEVTAAPAST